MSEQKLSGLNFVTASRGTKILGVATHTGEFAGFQVNGDATVIDSAKVDDEADVDSPGTYNKGMLITTSGKRFTEVVISAGSLIAIKH